MHDSSSSRLTRLRLPIRFTPFVFAFYMSGIMAMLMCIVIVGASTGLHDGYVLRVLLAYKLAMPVAFFCVLAVRPVVVRLVALSVRQPT
ncbi:MAG: DUF2798 domain-containing protein [Oxalicibacterium faecigallinarum]|uniref:DUF2798 domain-containing protein n=1 Tax=Oxalicibacterium faecigallinarum TaxID=573741 RepID=UPI002806BCE5|nr:DUF2798 domain-containing protein [Oxalicibacterium faecigallinarum]MDQ7968371.1 DUF2798 domain-containing protein [Oxalicibacterium faecigallinarum]